MTVKIAPSILSADFSRLGVEIKAIETAGADMIHLDVMDGHFVPNLTIGPPVIKALRKCTDLPFDTHLMISPADPLLVAFANAGSDIITIHPEATIDIVKSLKTIRELGAKAGVSLNPETPVSTIREFINYIDLILIMTVNPGFGGQTFMDNMLPKIAEARALIQSAGRPVLLEVDGGIDAQTAPSAVAAGAHALVAGTAIFKGPGSYAENIAALKP